ncbi:MAG: hypothetical protein ACOX5M_02930 [Bacillota bacterium]|jgi:hypothetical protein
MMIDEREHENPPLDEKERNPPRRGDYRLESPFYEEEFDPYFAEQLEAPRSEEDADRVQDPDDWYWREPDDYWLEQGMWPWPEPAPRRRSEPRPPEDIEPS